MKIERLTKRDENGNAHYPYCYEKCDGDGIGIRCQTCDLEEKICNKLADYEDLEEQGLLLKVPSEFGTDVFVIPTNENSFNQIACMKFLGIQWDTLGAVMNLFSNNRFDKNVPKMYQPSILNFGKTVFLTEQEAQSALEKMKAGGVNG